MDPEARDPRTLLVAEECLRQQESALYTSTALYIWLREARIWNQFFVVVPVLTGALSGVAFLQSNAVVATILAVVTGFAPALKDALRLDIHLDTIRTLAAEFKGLQDAFRQLGRIGAVTNPSSAERELARLMDELNRARAHSVTIPERVFKKAQEKIKSGDYDFAVDAKTPPARASGDDGAPR
jgi:hypothetical protein